MAVGGQGAARGRSPRDRDLRDVRDNGPMNVVVLERSLRDMVPTLLEFDGPKSLWRVPLAGVNLLLVRGVPVVAAVVVALVTVKGRVLQAAVAAVIALLFDALGKKLRARVPWRAPVANRLWTFEKPNPQTEVHVLVPLIDVARARTVLRRAKFNPQIFGLRLGRPPPDAVDLNYKIAVHEPEAWAQSASDEDRTRRIREVLSVAGIRGRVGGIDTEPKTTAAKRGV